ncbi:DUF177 domain-containing protein [Lachnospiraceae bacterium 29-84]
MKVDLADVISSEDLEITKNVEIELDSFVSRLGKFPIVKRAPFALSFANEGNQRLLVQGETELTIAVPCDRCLEETSRAFHLVIDKEIDLTGSKEGMRLEELDFMTGTSLDVDQLIFGEILVGWPMKVLCREDCKGICKKCGTNLNLAECQCQRTEPDPRMAAIQDIFNKFKEV